MLLYAERPLKLEFNCGIPYCGSIVLQLWSDQCLIDGLPAKKSYSVVCLPCGVPDMWSPQELAVYGNPQVFGLAGHLKNLCMDGVRGPDDVTPVGDSLSGLKLITQPIFSHFWSLSRSSVCLAPDHPL